MGHPQEDPYPAHPGSARWPAHSGPRHPLAAGVLCVALAVGAWHGLLLRFGQEDILRGTVARSVSEAKAADSEPGKETRRVVLTRPPATPPTAPAPSVPKPAVPGPAMPALKAPGDSAPKAVPDSAPRAKVSPFLRSHPWAASSGGKYYYPSSCPETLRLPDVVFFGSEEEARDSGYVPSQPSRCK